MYTLIPTPKSEKDEKGLLDHKKKIEKLKRKLMIDPWKYSEPIQSTKKFRKLRRAKLSDIRIIIEIEGEFVIINRIGIRGKLY